MYQFHYDYNKNEYGNKSKLSFTETDSLVYEIKTEDVYKVFNNDKKMFDFSNYSTKSKYYDDSNKLMTGKMKDETADVAIKEYVVLKRKMYSFLIGNSQHKKAKEVNRNFVATISHDQYKGVLLNSKCIRHSNNRIQSKEHDRKA